MYPQCQKTLFKTSFIYQVYLLVVHLHIPLTTLVWVLILWIQMARRNQLQEFSHIFSTGDVPNNFGAIFLCKVTTDKCWGDLFVVFTYPSMLNNWILFSLDLKHKIWISFSIQYHILFITCILFMWMFWSAC